MNKIRLLSVVAVTLLAWSGNAAMAACPGTQLSQDQIVATLGGKAYTAMHVTSGEDWKEELCLNAGNGGNLYKTGVSPDDPVDPRALRGTWSVITGGRSGDMIRFSYTGSATNYDFRVSSENFDDSGNPIGPYWFCESTRAANPVAQIFIRSLTGPCP